MAQQNLFDRLLSEPLAILAAGAVVGMYIVGTLEERRKQREAKDDDEVPAFVSDEDKILWEKFRQLYQAEMSNPDKPIGERLELLVENFERLSENVEELLDRTEPNLKSKKQETKDDLAKQ